MCFICAEGMGNRDGTETMSDSGSGRSRNTLKFRVKGKLPLNDVYCCKRCGLAESDDSGCPIFTPFRAFILADSVLPTVLLCQDFPRLGSFANNQANNANGASKAPRPTWNLRAWSHPERILIVVTPPSPRCRARRNLCEIQVKVIR